MRVLGIVAVGVLGSCSGSEPESSPEPESCGPWSGTLESPADFEKDDLVGPIVQSAGAGIERGLKPPPVSGDYCAEFQLLDVNGVPGDYAHLQTFVRLADQTSEGAIHYEEDGDAISGDAHGFITGEADRFTLWLVVEATASQAARSAGYCDERDAVILTGEVGYDGQIEADARTVMLWEEGCYDQCPGLWAHLEGRMTLLGRCLTCADLHPICSGLPKVCAGKAWPQCPGSPDVCDTPGCYVADACSGTPWPCSYHSQLYCPLASGCYWSAGACLGTPTPCNVLSASPCEDQTGCGWGPTCLGTPTACADLPLEQCEDQIGCILEVAP